MTSMRLPTNFLTALAVASLTIVGCGDSGDGKGDDAGTESDSGTGTTSTGDTDGATADDGGTTGSGSASGGETSGGDTSTSGADGSTGDTGGTTGGADDGFNCAIVIFCMEDCGDEACVADCLANGTSEGQGEANDLLDCDEANSCDFGDQCLDDNCAPELLACFSGELDCEEMSSCIDYCETICAGDQECEDICGVSCFYEGTVDAQGNYDDLVSCAEANTCTDDQCLMDNCGAELDACFP